VVVQGKEMKPDETEAAIDMVFTKLMPERLTSMTDEEFESYKEATAKAFMKPPLGFSDEVNQYWPSVAAMGQCFEKRLDELEYLRTGLKSKAALLDAYNTIVLPQTNSVRSRVVVKYWSQDEGGVPARPDFAAKKALMEAAGVTPQGIAQAEREYTETELFDQADSTVRAGLSAKYGHFSEDLKCRSSTAEKPKADDAESAGDETAQQASEDIQVQNQVTEAAHVEVGVHDKSQVLVDEGVLKKTPSGSPARRKKRADSAFAVHDNGMLSVDKADTVVRGERD